MGKYQVPAVVSATRVLGEVAKVGEAGASQAELAAATGLSKSTLHNLLSTLAEFEYVRRDLHTRRYRLGPALIPLGAAASRQFKLVRLAVDRVAPLAEKHRLTFAVAQRVSEDEAQVIERFYPASGVHVGVMVGSTYGPLEGALGKVLLASMEPARAERLVRGRRIPAHTNATITSASELLAQVEEVRTRGWASSQGELNENNAVAAGIYGPAGELELLYLVLGFANHLDGGRIEEVGKLLRSTADSVMAGAGSISGDSGLPGAAR